MTKTAAIKEARELLKNKCSFADEDIDHFLAKLLFSPYAEVRELASKYQARYLAEAARIELMASYEKSLYEQGLQYIAGIDEAGRGPLAGPVVAAAVILPRGCRIWGLNDSKKLSEARRLALEEEIKDKAVAYAVAGVNHLEIDRINIRMASLRSMAKAVERLEKQPEHLLIDAERLPKSDIPQTAIIKGDSLSISIAAASILAKNHRDRIMGRFDKLYPQYGFALHKGYPTPVHKQKVAVYGFSPIHRRTFDASLPEASFDKSITIGK